MGNFGQTSLLQRHLVVLAISSILSTCSAVQKNATYSVQFIYLFLIIESIHSTQNDKKYE